MEKRRTTFKRLGILAVILILCVSVLTACGGPANLEEAFQDSDVQSSLTSLEKKGIKVTAKDNTMIYTYTFSDSYDFSSSAAKKAVVSSLKSQDATLKSTLKSSVDTIEEKTGLSGISVKVIYKASNGKTLYTTTFNY